MTTDNRPGSDDNILLKAGKQLNDKKNEQPVSGNLGI
jgi:hypothetical protein